MTQTPPEPKSSVRLKLYVSVAVAAFLVIGAERALTRFSHWQKPALLLNRVPLYPDNVILLPPTNS